MISHPIILGVLALDIFALCCGGYAAWIGAGLVLHWRPDASDRRQLALERRYEAAVVMVRAAGTLFLIAGFLQLGAVAGVLPRLIPGAMCGTGVMQAMGTAGERAWLLRLLGAFVIYALLTVVSLDRRDPTAPLALLNGKLFVLLLPVVGVTFTATLRAFAAVDATLPVDCCAALLDVVSDDAARQWTLSDNTLTASATLLGVGLFVVALLIRLGRRYRQAPALLLGAIGGPFVVVGAQALIRVFSAYHYEVLSHHCPWCLFLPAHRSVGYPLFGALMIIGLELIALLVATTLARRHPRLHDVAAKRAQRALVIILFALVTFALLTAGPAVAWRLRFGTWLTG